MLKKELHIRNILLVVVLLILVIFGIIISLYQYKLITNDINSDMKIQNSCVHKTFNLFLTTLQKDISVKSDFMLSLPNVTNTFKQRDREKLYSLVKDSYTQMTLQNKYVKIMTFRLNDGSVFLRVHKPEMFGDSINKKRKIILDTISTKKRQYGFEVGKLKMTYRIVTPIFHDNKLVGVIEVGIEPEYITENINHLFEIQTALLIKKESKSISLNKSKMESIDDFLLARGSELFKNNLSTLGLDHKTNTIFYNNEEYQINTNLNLYSHKNEIAAKILLAYSMKEYNEKLHRLIKNNIFMTIFILFILLIVLNIGLNYFIKKLQKFNIEIIEKDQMMIQHSKMAAMGEMLESIAHQWRQPLSIITTSASSIVMRKKLGVFDEDSLEPTCDTIVSSAKHLSHTIDDFRNFFKDEKEKEFFNLKETFSSTFSLISSKFKNRNIIIIEDIESIKIHGFRNELIQVLINILNNARDALEIKDIDRVIFVNICSKNDKAIIKIKDNAGGIAEGILPQIYDAHFTTKPDDKGTGIGLYMSQNIINNSFHGTINAINKKFEYEGITYSGVEFTIELPLNVPNKDNK